MIYDSWRPGPERRLEFGTVLGFTANEEPFGKLKTMPSLNIYKTLVSQLLTHYVRVRLFRRFFSTAAHTLTENKNQFF